VTHTAEIGHLRITNAKYEEGVERIIFKLEG
jgi:hypothetical protein